MADIIFFAVLAGFILFRLFNVLGKSDPSEKNNSKSLEELSKKMQSKINNGNVIKLPVVKKEKEVKEKTTLEKRRELKEPEIADSKVAKVIEDIKKRDENFTAAAFIEGSKTAFEMVVNAFSKGDKTTLESLLSKDVYAGFAQAIEKAKKVGSHEETTLIQISNSDISQASIKRNKAQITVDFISEQIRLIKENDGDVISGDPTLIERIKDSWIFERDLNNKENHWQIVAT